MKKLRALVFAKKNDLSRVIEIVKKLTVILSRVIEPRELRFLKKPTGKKTAR